MLSLSLSLSPPLSPFLSLFLSTVCSLRLRIILNVTFATAPTKSTRPESYMTACESVPPTHSYKTKIQYYSPKLANSGLFPLSFLSRENVMFREYLKRLESNKICQNLNMQSFLLLPMQRITRLPLLILAILNRTPLDYPDQGLVESTLRNVQKVRERMPHGNIREYSSVHLSH